MTRISRAALVAASLLTLACAGPAAAFQASDACRAAAPAPVPPAKPKKKSALGGLLSAAARSGLGDVLIAEAGDEAAAQVASVVVDAARSGDALGAAADAGTSALARGRDGARNARLAGAAAGMARELRQQRAGDCAAEPAAPETPTQDEWN